jgi:hypothetical protein
MQAIDSNESTSPDPHASHSSLVGVATASTRAVASQVFAFYMRVPMKLFRPTRIE